MQVLSSTVDMLDRAVRLWDLESNVMLTKVCHYGQDNVLEYEVNWSACGSVPVETVKMFIDSLKTASRLADDINRSRYEVVHIDNMPGPELPDFARGLMAVRERAAIKELRDWMIEGEWGRVSRWLEHQRIS
jgi:hypothetical protein